MLPPSAAVNERQQWQNGQNRQEPRTTNPDLICERKSPSTPWAGTWPSASNKRRCWRAIQSTSPLPSDTTTTPNTAAWNSPFGISEFLVPKGRGSTLMLWRHDLYHGSGT